MLTRLPLFMATTWLLAMLPGPGQALMMRQTLQHGRRRAWLCVGGTATGILLWSVTAAAGLSAALLASPSLYRALRLSGALVLLCLGMATLRSLLSRPADAERPGSGTGPAVGAATGRRGRWGGRGVDYLAGLATNLGNPKAGVFAVSLIPQFVPPGLPVLPVSLLLGVVWALVTASWYLLFVWAVDRGRAVVGRPCVTRWTTAATGVVLMALGVGVALGI